MLAACGGNQVWRSTDGSDGTAVHDGRMWMVGGTDFTDYQDGIAKSDVWWTSDGENWTRTSAEAAFAPRWSHGLASYDGLLWVLTGFDRTLHDDVWRSEDGADWRLGFRIGLSLP